MTVLKKKMLQSLIILTIVIIDSSTLYASKLNSDSSVDYVLYGIDKNNDNLDDSDFKEEGTFTDQFFGKFINAEASDWITLQNNSGNFSFNGNNGVNKKSWMGSTLKFDIKLDQSYHNTYVPRIVIICMNNGVEKKFSIDIDDQVDLSLDTWQTVELGFRQEDEGNPVVNVDGVITGNEYQNLFSNDIAANAQELIAIRFTTYFSGAVTQAKFKLRDMFVTGTFEWQTQNTSFVHENEYNNDVTMLYRYSKKAHLSETGKLPAFIFLHGNGGGNNALGSETQWSSFELPIAATRYSTYIFEPKSGTGGSSLSTHQIDEFLDHIIANYDVDPDRIYLGGFSGGGIETSRYLTTVGADRLAAAYFINGAMIQSLKNYKKMDWSRVINLSTWIINNLNDSKVPHVKSYGKEGSTSRLNNVLVENNANNLLRLHETGAHSIKIPRNFTPSFFEFIYASNRVSDPSMSYGFFQENIKGIRIHPNPANNSFKLSNSLDCYEVQIMEFTGNIVFVVDELKADRLLHIQNLKPGMYIVGFKTENGVRGHQTFIKK